MNGNERHSQQSENNLSSTLPTGSPGPEWPVAGGGGTPATTGEKRVKTPSSSGRTLSPLHSSSIKLRMARRHIVPSILGIVTLAAFVALMSAMHCRSWEAATVFATLLVGLIAADVVVWQGHLIKQQIAFSTYLDLDKEWNSKEMIEARQNVHEAGTENWDYSRLEGILEFFEKLASMFKLSGDMPFIYQSTLSWYAAHYFLFAREHGRIQYLRDLWKDRLYGDLEELYRFYLISEVGHREKAQKIWEAERLTTETKFWEQERKD
jgi:hypothetical protein